MKINIKISFLLIIIVAVTVPSKSFAQSDYEKQTATFSIDLAKKIKESNKTKVAVSDFLDNDGNLTELGKAIAEDIGVGIVNEGKGTFQVMERSNLNAVLKEQKLSSTGLIDPETAKKLGKLKMVDAVIVGNITPFGNSFRVTIKILDTETGMSIAAAAGNLAGTDDIKGLFNKKITIFNPTSPANNTDSVKVNKNTKSLDIDGCESKNTGDYCFINKTQKIMEVMVKCFFWYTEEKTSGYSYIKRIFLKPGQSQCFYDLSAGIYDYSTSPSPGKEQPGEWKGSDGQFLVKKCVSQTFEIK